ncbi:3'-5' exonuclease [Salmonella enterica]|nr:3'-5' exonuclease [Salmonella enterica]EIC4627506.1 3'-5' exonuclease [Salmonella enterica subsp. enterica serovar Pomona]EIP4118984.1 3'-5' exonuclease [Salmonella enterica]EIX8160669.1 3'-5' exonuclease [Salmonella enterica]EJH1045550.1 3'-5' exonuclease [Salmonella enterica]
MQNIQKSILNMVMQKWLNSDYLIIDTETTGLDNNAEVIEIAIINMHGDVLLNSLVKPTCSIPAAVTKINNITDEMVADAPLWRDVFPVILNIIDGKKWLAWNSKFDARLIIQTGVITGYFEDLPASKILDIAAKINNSQIDAKAIYDQWYGEFDSKRNNFKRQRLTTAAERHNVSVNGAHRALADCIMVLGVINAVCHSDYAVFESRYAELVADNDKAMEAMKQANEAVKLAHSKFSKLAAENVALKSALNDILQPDAAVLERNHRVRALDAMETPATDTFLDEVRASGVDEVDELKEKLEAANRRSAERDLDCWIYEKTVKTLLERAESAESACTEAARILKSGERMALTRAVNILLSVGECATSYQYPVVLPEPIGWKSPSGHEVLKKKDVIAALMSAGVPIEGD